MPARFRVSFAALMAMLGACGLEMRAAETNTPPGAAVHLPLEIRRGAAFVAVRVNGSQPLRFKLDTGFGVTTIHPELVEPLGLRPAGSLTIHGIAGREKAGYYAGATFDFGGAEYSPRRVAVIPSDAERPRRARDGILGAGFFRRFVVEVDAPGKSLMLYEPASFDYRGPGEIIPLQFQEDTPLVEATIKFAADPPIIARYEIDSGCDGALCLGHDFVKSNRLDERTATRRNGSRTGVGGSVDTHEGRLPEFRLGSQTLTDVAANFFAEGSPAGTGMAGHIGLGVLREFKVILDYSRRRMILEPAQ